MERVTWRACPLVGQFKGPGSGHGRINSRDPARGRGRWLIDPTLVHTAAQQVQDGDKAPSHLD